jgi:hypothetical protein
MKTLIYFNSSDKPDNIGQSQLVDSIDEFIQNAGLVNALIEDGKLFFDKYINEFYEPVKGYAMIFQVPNDFQN